jgi:hypothetical protein
LAKSINEKPEMKKAAIGKVTADVGGDKPVGMSMRFTNLNFDVLKKITPLGKAFEQKVKEFMVSYVRVSLDDVDVKYAEGSQGSVVLQVMIKPGAPCVSIKQALAYIVKFLPKLAQVVSSTTGMNAATSGTVIKDVSAPRVWTAFQEPVSIAVRLSNIDIRVLQKNLALRTNFLNKVKGGIAQESGFGVNQRDVKVQMSAACNGSIVIAANVTSPYQIFAIFGAQRTTIFRQGWRACTKFGGTRYVNARFEKGHDWPGYSVCRR